MEENLRKLRKTCDKIKKKAIKHYEINETFNGLQEGGKFLDLLENYQRA